MLSLFIKPHVTGEELNKVLECVQVAGKRKKEKKESRKNKKKRKKEREKNKEEENIAIPAMSSQV